jgi:hypothetical protein
MIKLTEILQEVYIEHPKGFEAPEDDFMRNGFKLGQPETNPETGTISTNVEYLPEFETIRKNLISYRKEFQPFKYSANEDIAKISKEINTLLTKAGNAVFALDKMIELQKRK